MASRKMTKYAGLAQVGETFSPIAAGVAIAATLVGVLIGILNSQVMIAAIGGLSVLILLVWFDEVNIAGAAVVVSVLFDWYQIGNWHRSVAYWPWQVPVLAMLLACVPIVAISTGRLARKPWIPLPYRWQWLFLLLLAVPAAISSETLGQGIQYYFAVFVAALIMFVLGTQIARSFQSIHRLFSILTGFGTLIAVHTIVQTTTGITILDNSQTDNRIALVGDSTIVGGAVRRAGSFLVNPDNNGAFLVLALLLALGLLLASSSPRSRVVHCAQCTVMLIALIFTYSTAAVIALVCGLLALLAITGRNRMSIYILGFACFAIGGLWLLLPHEIDLLIQHATLTRESTLREEAWLTGVNVIRHFPLTGIGLGTESNYVDRALPYSSTFIYFPLRHPHNAFIELAAMAGLPVLVIFITIIGRALAQALQILRMSPREERALVGGGIAAIIALTINSLGTNGWTIAPLLVVAWLVLGAISSPGLTKHVIDIHVYPRSQQSSAQRRSPSIGLK